MSKGKYTAEEKERVIQECGKSSTYAVARKYEIGRTTLREWKAKYESMGFAGLQGIEKWTCRTEVQKHEAVRAYLEGNQSLQEVCKEFKIRSKTQLRSWIKKYNSHEELKSTNCGGGVHMTKGRAVTFEEKVAIVQFCIASDKDYAATIEKYKVSYQQIYSWIRKYEADGVAALEDRRGKRKPESALTEGDLLKAKIKLLEAQNKRLEMENDLLKKLEKIERRWF